VLFGTNAIFLAKPYPVSMLRDLAFVLYGYSTPGVTVYFILTVLVLSCVNLITSKVSVVTDILLWFLVVNLHNMIYSSLTGGDNLLNQFLFFNCFLSARYTVNASWQNTLKRFVHNLAVVAIITQVCLAYFLSAVAKLSDTSWLSGMAIAQISELRHFSLYAPVKLPQAMSQFLNYTVLVYQLLFPVLVWFNKIKKPFIIIGILMHLYIAFVMGLVGFGVIMIVSYVYFWPIDKTLRADKAGT
jgi:hypothetical protein